MLTFSLDIVTSIRAVNKTNLIRTITDAHEAGSQKASALELAQEKFLMINTNQCI